MKSTTKICPGLTVLFPNASRTACGGARFFVNVVTKYGVSSNNAAFFQSTALSLQWRNRQVTGRVKRKSRPSLRMREIHEASRRRAPKKTSTTSKRRRTSNTTVAQNTSTIDPTKGTILRVMCNTRPIIVRSKRAVSSRWPKNT